MVTVVRTDRKSAVLTASSLACLSHMPTINLTAGCAHGCLYCYARGYSIHPGENKVVIYRNTLDKLKTELARRRTMPKAVYFSPSSDIFQPVPEVLEIAYHILEFLFAKHIGVALVTKGGIPEKTMGLLLEHAGQVRVQMGIITLDDNIRRMFEPNTASTKKRLEQMARMVAGGISTEARIVPILPGCTDDETNLTQVFRAISEAGVRRAAISALFLRPAITASIRKGISDGKVLSSLFQSYVGTTRMAVKAENSSIVPLPRVKREELFTSVRRIAGEYGVEISICGCMNPDIGGMCNIKGRWPTQFDVQPDLFSEGD